MTASEANVAGLEQALRQAGRSVTFHRYPGTGHWFFEQDRLDAYRPDAAQLAWQRTIAFLHEQFSSIVDDVATRTEIGRHDPA